VYEANKKIYGLDRQHFYTFDLLRVEVGVGGAAFELLVRRSEGENRWCEVSKERKSLGVGESVHMPGLGWQLKLMQSRRGRARFGVGRGNLEGRRSDGCEPNKRLHLTVRSASRK
jgi:hypothetical protein